MRRLATLLLIANLAGASAQSNPGGADDQRLLTGARSLFTAYLGAVAANDGGRMAALYHDAATLTITRVNGEGQTRTLSLTGAQYKTLMRSVPLNEAPDRYLNPTFTVLKGGVVRIDTQRQSVSRGYTAPNVFLVQADAANRFWIVAEQGIQKVQ